MSDLAPDASAIPLPRKLIAPIRGPAGGHAHGPRERSRSRRRSGAGAGTSYTVFDLDPDFARDTAKYVLDTHARLGSVGDGYTSWNEGITVHHGTNVVIKQVQETCRLANDSEPL